MKNYGWKHKQEDFLFESSQMWWKIKLKSYFQCISSDPNPTNTVTSSALKSKLTDRHKDIGK